MTTPWRAVDDLLAAGVADGDVPGLVAVVGSADVCLHRCVVGVRNTRTREPMTADTMFRIASQAKLATTVLALQLVEEELLTLDTPVGDVVPEFDNLPVLDGFDGDRPILRPPKTRATIRQLLTHTSGLGYDLWDHDLARYYRLTGQATLATGSRAAFTAPLSADPGTRFHYSMGMDWLGLVIEAVRGRSLDECLAARITGPLGMTDTVMWMTGERRVRAAAVHVRDDAGGWMPTGADYYQSPDRLPEFYAGGHSMYATGGDYLRLQQLVLRGGAHAGGRLLSASTVDELFRDQLGGLDDDVIETTDPPASAAVDLRGLKWSLGLLVNSDGVDSVWPAGSAGWAGGFNTFYWIDRGRGVAAALYTQTLPFWDERVVDLCRSFTHAVGAAL